jgi:hypothetical protein
MLEPHRRSTPRQRGQSLWLFFAAHCRFLFARRKCLGVEKKVFVFSCQLLHRGSHGYPELCERKCWLSHEEVRAQCGLQTLYPYCDGWLCYAASLSGPRKTFVFANSQKIMHLLYLHVRPISIPTNPRGKEMIGVGSELRPYTEVYECQKTHSLSNSRQ